jgi:hypothetical protein
MYPETHIRDHVSARRADMARIRGVASNKPLLLHSEMI